MPWRDERERLFRDVHADAMAMRTLLDSPTWRALTDDQKDGVRRILLRHIRACEGCDCEPQLASTLRDAIHFVVRGEELPDRIPDESVYRRLSYPQYGGGGKDF